MSSPVDREERTPPARSEWEHDDDGSTLRFAGVEMRLRTLALAIIGTILVGGPFGIALMFVFNDLAHIPTRGASVLAGALLGLPLAVLLMLILRRRTKACAVAFGAAALSIEVDGARRTVPYRDLTLLRWVCDSEYARIVIRGEDGVSLSVLAGIARVPKGQSPALPPLPAPAVQQLEGAGLTREKARREAVTTFRRAIRRT